MLRAAVLSRQFEADPGYRCLLPVRNVTCLVPWAALGSLLLAAGCREHSPGAKSPPAVNSAASGDVRRLLAEGRLLDAVDAGRQGVARAPGDLDAVAGLADALVAAARPEEAVALLESVAASAPAIQVLHARALAAAGRRAEAVQRLDRVPVLSHEEAQIAARLSLDLLAPETAVRLLGRTPPLRPLESRLLLGRAYLCAARFDDAAAVLESCLAEGAGRPDLAFYYAVSLRRSGRRGRTSEVRDLLTSAAVGGGSGAVFYELGRCLMELGRPQEAIAALQQSGSLVQDWPEIWRDLAELHSRVGQAEAAALARARCLQSAGMHAEAVKLLDRLHAGGARSPAVVLALAAARFRAGDRRAGLELLRDLRRRRPDDLAVLRNLFSAEMAATNYQRALEAVESIARLDPTDPTLPRSRLELFRLLQRFEESRQVVAVQEAGDPQNPAWHYEEGLTLALYSDQPDRVPAAEAAFRRALKLRPDYPDAAYQLGVLLQQSGRPAEAIPWLRRAVDANPEDVHAPRVLALCHSAAGRADLAAEWMDRYRRLQAREQELAALKADRSSETKQRLRRFHAYLRLGKPDDALREIESPDLSGPNPLSLPEAPILFALRDRFQRQGELLGRIRPAPR